MEKRISSERENVVDHKRVIAYCAGVYIKTGVKHLKFVSLFRDLTRAHIFACIQFSKYLCRPIHLMFCHPICGYLIFQI